MCVCEGESKKKNAVSVCVIIITSDDDGFISLNGASTASSSLALENEQVLALLFRGGFVAYKNCA